MSTRFDNAIPTPYWIETVESGASCPPPTSDVSCDIAVIGGGFTGLWCALKARERHPDARIVVLEAGRCGNAASGRNGGFCAPSISHGVANAQARWPKEAEALVRLGCENLDSLQKDLERYGIDAEFERFGKLNVASTPWQAEGLKVIQSAYAKFGIETSFLEGEALREYLNSPVYTSGLFETNYALVNPGKLVEGLRQACLGHGIAIHEDTPVTDLQRNAENVRLETPSAMIDTARVAMATNAAVPLLKRLRMAVIPIYDYTLVTEPLNEAQLANIGWQERYGIADTGNQFHYFRKTADNRILWGGFDAIYHYGSRQDETLLHRPETYSRLEANFSATFPSLKDVMFTHAWGGVIDTSARTTFFAGTALSGRLAYAMGFTGQGVSASRFAALTMLDLLDGEPSDRTRLSMLRRLPVPFPPEPLRSAAIRMAQRHLAKEDQTGKRSLFLRTLDRFGIGFDS